MLPATGSTRIAASSPPQRDTAARAAATKQTIQQLSAGIESFRKDWQVYPPSDYDHEKITNLDSTRHKLGYYCLAYALMGPQSKGWGRAADYKELPFGGSSTATYGPYFTREQATSSTEAVQDAFRPARNIAYFRYEQNDNPQYIVLCNDTTDTTCLKTFASQDQFEFLAKPADVSAQRRWVRRDYLLISPGADRYWGPIKEVKDVDTGKVTVTGATYTADKSNVDVTCDDITNW
jgi:type II secretory pathway pseudopilin PulG